VREEEDDFGVAGDPPPPRPVEFTVVADDKPPPAPLPSRAARVAFVLGLVAWGLTLLWLVGDVAIFLAGALVLSGLAILYGVRGAGDVRRSQGQMVGRGLAIAGLVLGLVHLGAFLVLPILVLLLCCMGLQVSRPASAPSAPTAGSPSSAAGCPDCSGCNAPGCGCQGCGNCGCQGCGQCGDCGCQGCGCQGCGDCGCGNCGCGDCGCQGCGSCGGCGNCGGCACAALLLPAACAQGPPHLAATRRERWDRLFAHHPPGDPFRADVYVVKGVRLCVGCFTTYPAFLAGTAALLVAGPALPWAVSLGAGAAAASAQAISSAGWARAKAAKVAVKLLLGAGLALVLDGVRHAPWPEAAKTAALLATLALASLSALPRLRRLRASAAPCPQAPRPPPART